jgi:hypothetical protein
VSGEGVSFADDAPPVEREAPGFSVRLAGHTLTATMRDHFATEDDARGVVEGYLRAWIAHAALAVNRVEFEFRFERSEIIDRNPPPPVLTADFIVTQPTVASVALHTTRQSYPDPPDRFSLDPDAETLFTRWRGYIEGREPLESMAYACLTVLRIHGGSEGAATRFGIAQTVLRKLSHLSSKTGDLATARKITPDLRPRTAAEQAWLEAAVKALVLRAGEVAAAPGASLPQITMGDLPPL